MRQMTNIFLASELCTAGLNTTQIAAWRKGPETPASPSSRP
jgi:hypothetical protein